jgi:hypothetical protein
MSYIDDNIKDNEHVVYRTKLHWAMLLGPALLLIIGGLSIPSKGLSGLILFSLGLLWGILSSISYQTSEIGITDKRLLIRIGFPVRRTYDIALTNIELVDTYQPSLGKLLNFGKVILGLDGKKRGAFRMVDSPLEFRAQLEKQVFAVLKQEQAAKK